MKTMFSKAAAALALAGSAAVCAAASVGDAPITLISPFPPGGGTDTLTRMVATAVGEGQKWNMVVENKPGAGGNLALDTVARARPDGRTMVMAQTDNVVLNPWLYKKLSYDTFKDFRTVGLVAYSPSVFVVMEDSPYKTLADVVAAAKANPGGVTLGVPGVGSSGDLVGYLWRQSAGMELLHIPYKGWAQAYPDLVSKRIEVYTGSVATLLSQIRAGKVRALAVTSPERSPSLPDVPTFVESGYAGIDQTIWWGLMAPAATPDDTVAELNRALNQAISQPELRRRFEDSGYTVLGGSAEDMAKRYAEDHRLFGEVIKNAGIEPQ